MGLPTEPRVVITGAASGLGRAFARVLGARRARLLLSDVDESALAETARLAESAGASSVRVRTCDVRKLESVEALAALADEVLGSTDLLVNNAGVAAAGAVGEVPISDWHWVVDVNLWGVVYGCHAFVPRMRRQGKGHVLNVASAAGLLSAPHMGPYNVSKAGVVALSETLRAELSGTNVGVTVLCPTFFPTNIGKSARFARPQQARLLEKVFERSRWTPEAVAEGALEAVAHERLYAVPMADGRWMWRAKRFSPEGFQTVARLALGLAERFTGGRP